MFNLQKSELNYISKKELYGILDTMPFPIILTETDKTVRFANQEARKLGGYNNLQGRKCNDTFCRRELCNCPKDPDEKIQSSQQYFYKSNGEAIQVIKKAQPVHFNDELFFAQFFINLTEQQKKEKELKNIISEKELAKQKAENETNKFEQLFEGISEAIFVHDFHGKIIETNQKACDRLGYTAEEIKDLSLIDIIAPELKPKFNKNLTQILKAKKQVFESLHITKSGVVFPVEVSTNVVNFDGKQVVLGIARDITLRKSTENELLLAKQAAEQKEAQLKTIFNKVPSTIIVFDKETRILRINQKGTLKFNIDGNDAKNKFFGEVLNCANAHLGTSTCGFTGKCSQCTLLKFINSTVTDNIEYNKKEVTLNLVDDGKSVMHTVLLSTAILGSNGSSKYIATIDDITARKEMETELVTAKVKAEMSEKLKSAFLNNISHEIRTPLNGLLGFLDFFDDDMDQIPLEERRLFVKTMRGSGDRLLHTVEDIIEASKLDSGVADFKKEQIKLHELTNTLVQNVNEYYSECGLEFNCHFSDELQENHIYSDESKLLRIIQNLLDNAFKFTKKGSVMLNISPAEDAVKISVKDTGIGIAKEHLEVIYEPFRQADINMNRAFEGNGLGLTISHKLCRLLGSELKLKSTPGEGSEFWFTLPLAEKKLNKSVVQPPQSKISGSKTLSGKTILVAEDDETNYLFLEAVLAKEGCKLIHASNGKEAVNLFSECADIDLIIMDLKMPVMNGIDATMKIKAMDKNVPIIAHSAYVLNNEKEQSLTAGCVDYLPKPVKKQELIKAIRKNIIQKTKIINC